MSKEFFMNIPFVEDLEQMLGCAKIMKDLGKKKRTMSFELAYNMHHCSIMSFHLEF